MLVQKRVMRTKLDFYVVIMYEAKYCPYYNLAGTGDLTSY
jgi:hypothetical protein